MSGLVEWICTRRYMNWCLFILKTQISNTCSFGSWGLVWSMWGDRKLLICKNAYRKTASQCKCFFNFFLQVWSKYGEKLSDLAREDKREDAVECLNELISNALELIPDCILYMSRLKNQSIFNFCAIPQVTTLIV